MPILIWIWMKSVIGWLKFQSGLRICTCALMDTAAHSTRRTEVVGMIMVYESAGCSSCRKAKAWLTEQGLDFSSKNIQSCRLTRQELKALFSLSTDIYDLISTRSALYKSFKRIHKCDLEDLSFQELISYIQANPMILKRPIITNGRLLLVGWDEDEITVFLPKDKRKMLQL